jgi:hypothetical protein
VPNVTGTITDSAGTPVQGALVRVVPAPSEETSAQAYGGVGITLEPLEYSTAADGTFSVPLVVGFTYTMEIPAIGYLRTFPAPTADTRFDLLGFVPVIESVVDYVDEAGTAYNSVTIKVLPTAVINERFSYVSLERAATKGGAYAEVDQIVIEVGEPVYTVEDAADNTVYYRARYRHATNGDSAYSELRPSDTFDEQLLISIDELKAIYLFGVSLINPSTGEPYPTRMFEQYIRAAIGWLETELDMPLSAINVSDERHDHHARDYANWGWFDLDRYPVIRIDRVWFQYPSMTEEVDIDMEWVELLDDGQSGQVNIVPGRGSIADVLLIPGSLFPMWSGATGRVPAVWHFDYRAGFEPHELPAEIKHLIGMAASIGVLNIAGDLIAGAGIASLSISVPGLSQSIGTTSSATNSGYGSRILEYQKEIKQQLPAIRRYYKGLKMIVV